MIVPNDSSSDQHSQNGCKQEEQFNSQCVCFLLGRRSSQSKGHGFTHCLAVRSLIGQTPMIGSLFQFGSTSFGADSRRRHLDIRTYPRPMTDSGCLDLRPQRLRASSCCRVYAGPNRSKREVPTDNRAVSRIARIRVSVLAVVLLFVSGHVAAQETVRAKSSPPAEPTTSLLANGATASLGEPDGSGRLRHDFGRQAADQAVGQSVILRPIHVRISGWTALQIDWRGVWALLSSRT